MCKLPKKLKEFGKHKNKKNNLNCWCKECCKNYYKRNSQKILKQSRESHKKQPWRRVLNHIKQRCNNQNNPDYKYYGGRGIKNKFKNADEIKFLWFRDKAYLMKQPSIDRIDNDGNYCLKNCRFIEFNVNHIKDRYKPVLQYDLAGNFIKEWKSIKEASLHLKMLGRGHISDVASGKRKTAGGFIWKFKN
jgi:hypothetical protein